MSDAIQKIRPREFRGYLGNPHKGTATFQRFNGDPLYPGLSWNDREGPVTFPPYPDYQRSLQNDRYPPTTVAYCRWVWSVMEPEKGTYRWDIIDGALETARERGQTLQLRIQPYVGADSFPAWYRAAGGALIANPDSGAEEPDHNVPAYLEHWGDFLRAFGARYDGHPLLESFDVAYGGSCGETGGNASPETAEKLVDVYLRSFRKTQLVVMMGTHGGDYALAKREGLAWRVDCYGDLSETDWGGRPSPGRWNHMFDYYPMQVVQANAQDAWKKGPVTLETCWTTGYWFKRGWDVDFILQQGLKYHASVFMPKSSGIPEAWREQFDAFNRRLGYRFVLRQIIVPADVPQGERLHFTAWVENVGVAPIYHPYRLAFRFQQGERSETVLSKADPRAWLPGDAWLDEEIVLPQTLQPGPAQVSVGLVDAAGQARVKFAIEGVGDDGWFPVGSVEVLAR